MTYRVQCTEVWGGIENTDQEVETGAVKASVFSRSADGGKGGDIYYFSVCGMDQLTRIAVADVMGHGEEVSRISGWVYDTLKQHLQNPAGDEVVRNLNTDVERRGFGAMTTVVLASIIVKHGCLYFTYAGHPPMMVWRRRDRCWKPARLGPEATGCNIPLGVMPDACYDQCQMALEPGDKLFIYTDGVLEAPGSGGEPFGEDRLLRILDSGTHHGPGALKEAVIGALYDHGSGRIDHDDVTILAVEASRTLSSSAA